MVKQLTARGITGCHHPILQQYFRATVAICVKVLRTLLQQDRPLRLELGTVLLHLFGLQPGLVPWFTICDFSEACLSPCFLGLVWFFIMP